MIYAKKDSANLYCTLVQIKSPFIEHIVQSFFHNFGRVRVDNHKDDLHEQIIDNINKFIKI
jgi:hypothetical protein